MFADKRLLQVPDAKSAAENKAEITIRDFPQHPPVVCEYVCPSNDCIYDDDQLKKIFTYLNDKPDGYYSAKEFSGKYNIVKFDHKLYAICLKLSKGSYGYIYAVQCLEDRRWYALKEQYNKLAVLEHERENLQRSNRYVSYVLLAEGESRLHAFMLMDFVPGCTLRSFIINGFNVPGYVLLDIAVQMLQEVQQMHECGLLHLDLYEKNFLIDTETNKVKLIDMGVSQSMDEKGEYHTDHFASGVYRILGKEFIEMFNKGQLVYSECSEVAAVGFCLIRLFKLDLPAHTFEVVKSDTKKVASWQTVSDSKFIRQRYRLTAANQLVQPFVSSMIADDVTKRPSLAYSIEFFKQAKKTIQPHSKSFVGIVDIDEFYEAYPLMQDNIFRALVHFNETILVSFACDERRNPESGAGVDEALFDEFREMCVNSGVVLRNHYYLLKDDEALLALPSLFNEQEHIEIAHQFCFVTLRKNTTDIRARLSKQMHVLNVDNDGFQPEFELASKIEKLSAMKM